MAIIGPRPLLVKYLPFYNEVQRHRHDVRPGLTGNAQAHGRNSLNWDEKFKLDIDYIENITFLGDVKIIFDTLYGVITHNGISQEGQATMEDFEDYVNSKKLYK